MRVWRFAFLLLAASSAAAADKVPHLKAGEWQIVRLGNENDIPDVGSTVCFADQSVLAKFDTIPDCIRKEVHTYGAITTADARCHLHGEIFSYHTKALKLDDDNVYTYLHAAYFPPGFRGSDNEQDDLISFTHLKRVGPCRPGERPIKY